MLKVAISQILLKNRVSNKTDVFGKQISFSKEKCLKKNLITNILLEQLFHATTFKPLKTGNPVTSTKTVHKDSYKHPKKPAKASNLKDQCKTSIYTVLPIVLLSYHLMKIQLIQWERIAH